MQQQSRGSSLPSTGSPGARPRRTLWIWLMLPPLFLIVLNGCGWVSLLQPVPLDSVDARSLLVANYRPWATVRFEPVTGQILDEILRDTGRGSEPVASAPPGSFWPTPGIRTPPIAGATPYLGPPPSITISAPATTTMFVWTITPSSTPLPSITSTPTLPTAPTSTSAPPQATNTALSTPGGGQLGTDQPEGNN